MKPRTSGCWLLPLVAAGATVFACATEPQSAETKTNWFQLCDTSTDCSGGLGCVCGLCSTFCDSETDCGQGVCGSEISTASQCAQPSGAPSGTSGSDPGGDTSTGPERMCLPASAECDGAGRLSDDQPIEVLEASGPPRLDCLASEALFCEDFDAPLGTHYRSTGELESEPTYLSNCRAYSGTSALRVTAPEEGVDRQIISSLTETVDSGDLYLRYFLYLDGEAPIGGFMITTELWSSSLGDEKISVDLAPDDALAVVVLTDPAERFAAPPASLQRHQWMCVQLHLVVDDAVGSLTLSVDDAELLNETDLDTRAATPIDSVLITSLIDAGSGGVQYYMDDFVVARAPIGCDAP